MQRDYERSNNSSSHPWIQSFFLVSMLLCSLLSKGRIASVHGYSKQEWIKRRNGCSCAFPFPWNAHSLKAKPHAQIRLLLTKQMLRKFWMWEGVQAHGSTPKASVGSGSLLRAIRAPLEATACCGTRADIPPFLCARTPVLHTTPEKM